MDIVHLIVWLGVLVIAVCVVWWLINQAPLDPMAKKVITIASVVICAVIAIILLLQLGGVGTLRVP